ncbi:hypothetical protein [Marinicella gelatinilytica]|uniref:hypothetical protein n=1 Tax=Marinicella gelatinilytica TaxID=2996017 RepID=UPI0022609950|nr:hypothetical protein [Marinicella gelatinilytica]MCX7544427.1 hypothetical protein [Marinicella gelatinilytica]
MINSQHYFGVISLECQTALKNTLDKSQAAQLGEQMALELSKVLHLSPETSLVIAAASYPTEALLKPGFAVHNNLLKYASAAFQGEQHQHRVLSIGAHHGNMPEGLQPPKTPAPLMHVPFVLITEDSDVGYRFEHKLLDKGMVSPPTYQLLSKLFQGQIVHANYMTHLDLIAMMHNHYNQVGMHHLWQVIESALLSKNQSADINHNRQGFHLRGQQVFMPFYTLKSFYNQHPKSTEQDYIVWLMAQRLADEVFHSHGLETGYFLTDSDLELPIDKTIESRLIEGDFYYHNEPSELQPEKPQLEDYMHPDAGYVWTVLTETNGHQHWLYPLNKFGQAAIDDFLESQYGNVYQAAIKLKRRLDGRLQESSGCH